MSSELVIQANWERIDEGPPEEQAAFAAVSIHGDHICLTEGTDPFVNRVRTAPLLSAYHLAEWLAWNWWRLRWEPAAKRLDWDFSHRMATIGAGYVWPNITVISDGVRIALISQPTRESGKPHFRYFGGVTVMVAAGEFENSVSQFVEQVRGQLKAEGIPETNLDRIWNDVGEERNTPALAQYRKIEALLGFNPDEGPADTVQKLLADAEMAGTQAISEIAAEYAQSGLLVTSTNLEDWAQHGFEASPQAVVRLNVHPDPARIGRQPAWQIGATAAIAIRQQERLSAEPITNEKLAELAGVSPRALTEPAGPSGISFALDQRDAGRVCLRPKWETGRRFDLARLLGDRLLADTGDRVWPATHSYTYRQKMQRAFAAELLSPFEAVQERLAGDYSAENREELAAEFNVSEWVIRTLLVNHQRLGRETLDGDFDLPG